MERISFIDSKVLSQFFEESKIIRGDKSWAGFASFLGTSRGMLDN